MRINLNFTNKGRVAIGNYTNDELLEIFTRYIKTLSKHYAIDVFIPAEDNTKIVEEGILKVTAENVQCDPIAFFKELGRDVKVPFKKRHPEKLDAVFKIVLVE
ncbi:hypothetical protein E0485_13075 [Paenibacillus albiflavus]|uniref:Uncharacterized protein n=1 Tax=Paenibacillus albiflavus TaxID=2545760 RepID=A0A4R4EC51_9BACL|nr:hypothetical protein [Paenibacillus albiflavus]TCZ76530.1 hypothetical protein E0485_13075 [Paenibacillus albiflavus]